ncbi:alpha/beta fold hydrolase [Halalkalicoccus ordinarius]|uniref:alpha/beta fold hydrolase n=1 Tax=Halalkalicoccus ordinarius TaxID=3116651 RepID=UPI00300F2007
MNQVERETEIEGVDVAGPADAQPIVFVHGAMFTGKMWAPQRDALSEEFRVIAPDLPGHGARSDETFRLEPALDLLDEVIDTLAGGHAILVGLSLGGYVSTEYASRHPEKVDGLVVTGSSANPVGRMKLVTRAVGGVSRLATRSDRVEQRVRNAGEKWVRERDLSPEIKEEIIDAGIYPRQFGEAGPDLEGKDFRAALATYPGPTLVLNGSRDLVMQRGAEDHASAANDSYLASIDGVGHIANLHRPETFTDAIRRFSTEIVGASDDESTDMTA